MAVRTNCKMFRLLVRIFAVSFVSYVGILNFGRNLEISYSPRTQLREKISQPTIINDSQPFCGYLIGTPWTPWTPWIGRLGNQMFVYASFYGMIRKSTGGKEPLIHVVEFPSSLDASFENLSVPRRTIDKSWWRRPSLVRQEKNGCCVYDDPGVTDLKCDGKNVLISGFRSSFKYFAHVMDEIRREFTFKKTIRLKCQNLVKESLAKENLTKDECVTVGVHLRRGDFTLYTNMRFGFSPAKEEYLQDAIRFFETTLFRTVTDSVNHVSDHDDCLAFLIFGNDYEWIVNATKNVQLLRPNHSRLIRIDYRKSEPAVDLCAMSLCDHMIISTGTFGWWAGFFSRGMVTYQSQYAMPNTSLFQDYVPADYFLPHWIGI